MKMTIQEVINKLNNIDRAIAAVADEVTHEVGSLQKVPLDDAIELLEEYADVIRNTKVDI